MEELLQNVAGIDAFEICFAIFVRGVGPNATVGEARAVPHRDSHAGIKRSDIHIAGASGLSRGLRTIIHADAHSRRRC
jgi:hypothetical protein